MEDEQLNQAPPESKAGATVKHTILLVLLLVLIVASFWFSFQLGRKLLMPGAGVVDSKVEIAMPEIPDSIAGFQEKAEVVEQKELSEPAKQVVIQPKKSANAATALTRPKYYKVQAGFFETLRNANAYKAKLRDSGFAVFVKKTVGGYRVQVGAYKSKARAETTKNKLTAKGFQAVVIYE